MIELTQLDGTKFSLNEHLIEVVLNIPETKVLLTNGKYYLVQESRSEVDRSVLEYERKIYSWHSPGKTGDSRKRPSRGEETS
jgi:flagellar protein FlbD